MKYSQFGMFMQQIEQLFDSLYGLTLNDVGYNDEDYLKMFKAGDDPQAIVNQYGDKYDLTEI